MDEDSLTLYNTPSYQCFRYLAEQAGIPAHRDDFARSRDRAEDYVARRMLNIDRRQLAERLRRWANAH